MGGGTHRKDPPVFSSAGQDVVKTLEISRIGVRGRVFTAGVRRLPLIIAALLALAPAGAKAEEIHIFPGVAEFGPAPTGPCEPDTAQAAGGPTVLGTLARLRQKGALSDEDAAR